MARKLNVALIGQRFMGRAHSNALGQAARFFDLPLEPVLHTVAGRDSKSLEEFRQRWGWARATTRWQDLAEDPEVQLVDIGTPNHCHAEQAVRMLAAGKHVASEKPLAGTLSDARAMAEAARAAADQHTFVWFNYRRCPAVGMAYQWIREGRVGRIYRVRAQYLQSWGGPETEMSWRFQQSLAGSGAHGDLNSHLVDLARFLTGEEFVSIDGALARSFVTERKLAGESGSAKCDVDDAFLFQGTLQGGAAASFEASRVAAPHLNSNSIEINGELGSLRFELDQMNTLQVYDARGDTRERGWTHVVCTSARAHPYVDAWWPEGHLLGYEHTFTNTLADMLRVLGGAAPELPLSDFEDAYQTQRVLGAAQIAAREGCRIELKDVR